MGKSRDISNILNGPTQVDAGELDGLDSTHFLNYNNLTNTPTGRIALTDLSVQIGSGTQNSALTYNDATGVFTYQPPTVDGALLSSLNSSATTAANNAANSATSAASSATTATTKASEASTSAGNAATSATAAASSASTASGHASTSTTKASEASTSASNASTSETNAATSASNAATSASNASTSASTASSASSTATTKASEASTSASNAATSESNAASSASSASTSAGTATTKASEAATSASNASTSASTASTAATNAASSASSAASAQTAAESARDSALAAYDNFDDRYLGVKSSAPSVDNDGDALIAGALYFDSTSEKMQLYTGSAWVDAYTTGSGFAPLSGATFTGAVTVPNLITSGNVDGRDVSVDGTKLDTIESNATADQTASEIRTLVENASDSNVFTDADHTKLNNIEANATADQTGAEIKSAYEGESDTNALTDALLTKLNGIETSATADQSASEIKTAYESNSDTNAFTDAEKTKLSGIATGAEVNVQSDFNASSGDAQILNKPTTIAGYGITDAFDGAFSSLSGKPTTISGYGITDALQLGTSATTALAGNTSIPSTLTDLGISDGSANQVLSTNGSGTFTFVDQSGGGGSGDSIADADGDTKIQVEEGTDDDTIRFDTAGSERVIITPTGNIGINTTTPYDSQWGSDGNNTELAIEGGSTGYGVIHLRGTGAGSTDTRFSMGVGDTKYYMAYDRIDGAHRMVMNTDGAIGFSTQDVGTETLTINKVGSSSYGSIQLRRSDTDNTNQGGILTFAQKDDASTSWLGMAGWDNGTDRTVYLGGGGWSVEEATAIVLYTGSYDAGSSGASERLRIKPTGQSLFKHDVYATGMVRATGWYNTPTGTTGTSGAMEIGVSGSTAFVHGYNRDSSSYLPVNMTGQGITLNARGTDPGVTLSGDANQVIRYTGSGTSPYMRFTTSGTANGYIQFTNTHSFFWNDRANRGIRISSGGLPYFYNGSSYDELHRNSYSVDMIANKAYSDNWFRCNGDQGLYWQGRGRGITSPEQAGNSYGNITTYSTGRNSWQGYGIQSEYAFMGRDGNNDVGLHDTNHGWAWYWKSGNDSLGIGTSSTSSSYRLYVSGQIYATSNITAYSDRRSKENIITIDNALDKTLAMRGVYYNKRFGEDKSRQIGVIAQEVNEVCPELVTYAEDVDEYGVSYGNTVGLLIEAIKELKGQVDDLQAQVQELQG